MASNTEKENRHPEEKRLSLKLKDKEPKDRFPLLPSNEIEDAKKVIVPKNTQKST
jgi:hypothetical protein